MAEITLTVPINLDWPQDAALVLYLGSENAADLANSQPAGGTEVASVPAWPGGTERPKLGDAVLGETLLGVEATGYKLGDGLLGAGVLGQNDVPPAVLRYAYDPDDVDATLPVGVAVRDGAGNESAKLETTVQLADPPAPATDAAVGSTGNANEARLSWAASADV